MSFDVMLSPVSNRADWIDCVEIKDAETGDPYDLTTADDIIMVVLFPGNDLGGGYGYSYGAVNNYGLTASLKRGSIQHVQPGIFQFHFTNSQMGGLAPQSYNVGLIIVADDQIIYQVIVGQVPVLEGYARAGAA